MLVCPDGISAEVYDLSEDMHSAMDKGAQRDRPALEALWKWP